MGEEGQSPANARGQVVMKHFTGPNGCGRIQTTMNPSSANRTRHHTSSAIDHRLQLCHPRFMFSSVLYDRPEMISISRFHNTFPQNALLVRLSLIIDSSPAALAASGRGTLCGGERACLNHTTRPELEWRNEQRPSPS